MNHFTVAVWLIIIAFTLQRLQVLQSRRQFATHHDCKSPRYRDTGDPIFGIRGNIEAYRLRKANRTLQAIGKWYETYGSTFVTTAALGETNIRTCNESNLQTIFATKSSDYLVGTGRLPGMGPFMGEGFLTTDGPVWDRSRTILKPSFHKNNISDLTATRKSAEQLLTHIPRDGATVDMQPLLLHLFTDTAALFLLGSSTGILDQRVKQDGPVDGLTFRKEFQLSLKGCGIRIFAGRLRFLVPKSLTTAHWKVVWQYIDDQVSKALEGTQQTISEHVNHSLLEGVLQHIRDKIEIRNQIIQGMTAAQDTTAAMVSNTLFLLARHPKVWERVRAEAAGIAAKSLNLETTKQLKFIRNVFKESMRLHPVFSTLGRTAHTQTILPKGGGMDGQSPIFVGPGTHIQCDFHILHRNKDIYGDSADIFDPDRWNHINPGPWQYMPFGGGPRACLGQHKALAEACCVIVTLAQHFHRLESRDDGREWVRAPGLVAQNANGCKVAFYGAAKSGSNSLPCQGASM